MESPRIVLPHRVLQAAVGAALLGLAAASVASESLWDANSAGVISTQQTLRVGDLVTIQIDSAAAFDFEATASDNKTVSLALSGGEFGDLFSFLPTGGSSGDLATAGGQSYSVDARVGARVVETDASGNARLQGARSVALASREESVSVGGWLDPRLLGAARVAFFSDLTDGVLSITSFLAPAAPILDAGDLVLPEAATVDGPAARGLRLAPAAAPDVDDLLAAAGQLGGAVAPTASQLPKLSLSDERQRELLLQYLNRLIDLVFQ
jgi:hypothetical protein